MRTVRNFSVLVGYIIGLAFGTFLVAGDDNIVASFVLHLIGVSLVYLGVDFVLDKLRRK